MIKAFLFDYDGVITPGVDVALPSKRLAANTGIPVEKASEVIKNIWADYSTGKTTASQVWKHIENELGLTIPEDKRNIWHTWDELMPLPAMLELVKQLKDAGYPVGLVSNVFKDTADIIREHGGYDGFDFLILSCEVGARKPDPAMYEAALAKLPSISPSEIVYLDDREQLTLAASELGFQSIYVTDHQAAIKRAQELLGA
jgi:epoxide hydrolase-like predicted phosphatase